MLLIYSFVAQLAGLCSSYVHVSCKEVLIVVLILFDMKSESYCPVKLNHLISILF